MDRRVFLAAFPALAVAGRAQAQASTQVRTEGKTVQLITAARSQINKTLTYDPAYSRIPYPNGDVPLSTGVCTDVIIRAYRALGVDLQKLVHEDMRANFSLYPKTWGLKRPDSNIDHRRVPNLRVFLTRHGQSLPVSTDPKAYKPGDLITNTPAGRPHIAVVSDHVSPLSGRLMVIQNIGWGAKLDDDLLSYPMTGHYRYAI